MRALESKNKIHEIYSRREEIFFSRFLFLFRRNIYDELMRDKYYTRVGRLVSCMRMRARVCARDGFDR